MRVGRMIARRIIAANGRAKASWNDPKWQKSAEPEPEPLVLTPPKAVAKEAVPYLPHVDQEGYQWRRTLTEPPWSRQP